MSMGLVLVLSVVGSAAGQESKDIEFFEAKIRPVLETHCLKCHSSKQAKGGLALDHRAGLLRGGDSGPALIAGKSKESLLLKALRHDGLEMPPDKRLPAAVVADFASWIDRGAADPRDQGPQAKPSTDDWEKLFQQRLQWWSLQPIKRPEVPVVRDAQWPRNEVDRFILHRLESQGLAPAPPASRRTLARRLSFALTGLPPATEDVERLVANPSPEAYEQ